MKQIFDIFSKTKPKKKKTKELKKIIIDYREKNSLVAAYLKKHGLEIEFKYLKVGDYIVNGIVIERKAINDFLSSIINRRMMKQIEELKQFKNKLLIIEGTEERRLYYSNINANAIRGFLLSIALKHRLPLIFSENPEDTAKFIEVLSKKRTKEISLQVKKKILNKQEQLQFIVESFPGIGPKKSKQLLKKFKTIQNLINASTEDLEKIIGKKLAKKFIGIINARY